MLWKICGYGQLHLQPLVSSRWKNFLPLLDKWLEKAVGYLWLDYKVYWLEFYLHDYFHLLQRLGLSHITAHCKYIYLTIVKLCQYLGFTILSNQRLRNPYERNPIVAKAEYVRSAFPKHYFSWGWERYTPSEKFCVMSCDYPFNREYKQPWSCNIRDMRTWNDQKWKWATKTSVLSQWGSKTYDWAPWALKTDHG